MRVIITGMGGTLGPILATCLEQQRHAIFPWNRQLVSPDNPEENESFIREISPHWFYHLATGSPVWAETIARICFQRGIRLVFTSSVSVFSPTQIGPFTTEIPPQATDDYGRYKIECEKRIRQVNPRALIVRLGWQIGDGSGSNQMVDYLESQMKVNGKIDASSRWFPACAFLTDTAESLCRLIRRGRGGIYHLDGNPGLNFYQIAMNLNNLQDRRWKILPTSNPVINHLMTDSRVKVKLITSHFITNSES